MIEQFAVVGKTHYFIFRIQKSIYPIFKY